LQRRIDVVNEFRSSTNDVPREPDAYPDPQPKDLADPLFNAVWNAIKDWDTAEWSMRRTFNDGANPCNAPSAPPAAPGNPADKPCEHTSTAYAFGRIQWCRQCGAVKVDTREWQRPLYAAPPQPAPHGINAVMTERDELRHERDMLAYALGEIREAADRGCVRQPGHCGTRTVPPPRPVPFGTFRRTAERRNE
jgi:hypothetical protein